MSKAAFPEYKRPEPESEPKPRPESEPKPRPKVKTKAFVVKLGSGYKGTDKTAEELAEAYGLNPDGSPRTEPAPDGPACPPVTPVGRIPLNTTEIPPGCSAPLTQECANYLNERYGLAGEAPPESTDFTGTITAFTAENPTIATTDLEDQTALKVGGFVTLEALTGEESAMAVIGGARVGVLGTDPVTLDLDLSTVDVTGLTADYVREDPV